MPLYTLHYFDARARGEAIRYLLEYLKIDYVDNRVPMRQFGKIKSRMPFEQLPVLELQNGDMLGESTTILRYIARENGLDGQSSLEKAQVDEHIENMADIYTKHLPVFFGKLHKDKEEEDREFTKFKPYLDMMCSKYETVCKKTGEGYLVGSAVTAADLVVAEGFDKANCFVEEGCLNKFPALEAFVGRIHGLPSLKEYVAKRPTEMEFYD